MGPKGREKARFTYFGKPRWVRGKGLRAAQPGHQTGQMFEWPRLAFQISRPDSGTNRRARPPTRKPNRRAPDPPRARKLCPGRPPRLWYVGREHGVVGGRQPVTLPQGPCPAPRRSSLCTAGWAWVVSGEASGGWNTRGGLHRLGGP